MRLLWSTHAIVLDGEIWAMMDEDERLMKRGDVLIQRATSHAQASLFYDEGVANLSLSNQ